MINLPDSCCEKKEKKREEDTEFTQLSVLILGEKRTHIRFPDGKWMSRHSWGRGWITKLATFRQTSRAKWSKSWNFQAATPYYPSNRERRSIESLGIDINFASCERPRTHSRANRGIKTRVLRFGKILAFRIFVRERKGK